MHVILTRTHVSLITEVAHKKECGDSPAALKVSLTYIIFVFISEATESHLEAPNFSRKECHTPVRGQNTGSIQAALPTAFGAKSIEKAF